MKRNVKDLIGIQMGATDGEIGKVRDFYFDDETWIIRYLVVETGKWLFERKVLISPESILTPSWDTSNLPVNLSIEQIKNSPDIDTEKPVSRQQEIKLYQYYPWKNYWGGDLVVSGLPPPSMYQVYDTVTGNTENGDSDDNPHLRSMAVITGYKIKAVDGDIGTVEDFIIDDKEWKILYMVIDTGKWLPGKKVLISPDLIKDINWDSSAVTINASMEYVLSDHYKDLIIKEEY